jgi:hypothetical protein
LIKGEIGMNNLGPPQYFIASFGGWPKNINHPVDGWKYPLGRLSVACGHIDKGDVMLLYCTGSYLGHYQEAPGIGIVLDKDGTISSLTVYYRYLPLSQSISRGTINKNLLPGEKDHFINPGANFIFEIKNTTFKHILAGNYIYWP